MEATEQKEDLLQPQTEVANPAECTEESKEEVKLTKSQLKKQRKLEKWLDKKQKIKESKKLKLKQKKPKAKLKEVYKAVEDTVKEVVDDQTGQVQQVKINRKEKKKIWLDMIKNQMKLVIQLL